MLHIHYSNRPERLADALVNLLRISPPPLLTSETILVPSSAVARWLNFRIADGLGIATQIRPAFPAAYVWQLFGRVLPEVASKSPFEREAMQWHLMRLIGESRAPEMRRYLENDDGMRQYELARQLAALFDRYLVERPEWIAAWSRGERIGLGPDEGWQAELWRALLAALPPVAREHPRARFFAALEADPALHAKLPARLNLFCVEAMPELYWQVFVALAAWVEIHLFVLTPCREYWGDLARERSRLRIEIERPAAAPLFDVGHPLLASLGRARQHSVARLAEAAAQLSCREEEDFVLPPPTLLGALQRDILELTRTPAAPDFSLQIHACHGAQREAEVLHDRLLELFETLPDLQPGEILILTPEIETYGPIIEAVLNHAPSARRLPCTVADRPLAAAPLWRALQLVCRTAAAELDAESVLRLLEEPAVRRAFAIDAEALPRLRDWVAAAGIRWGIDGAARARRGLPDDDAFSWRAGLSRLLLGVALPETERLWQGMLPAADIEGDAAALLGRFVEFAETLFELQAKLGAGKTAPEWCTLLLEVFERCLAPEEAEESQAQRLRDALRRISANARDARCSSRLPLAAMLRELDELLASEAPLQTFLAGSATIAALKPGRPVPARVICLIGMNDGCWPRPRTLPAFDLLARHARAGDRNIRAEERYAFLEALLCARDAVVITYTGRDPRSNNPFPPAPPLAELIDVLAAMSAASPDAIVVEHPLQPFSSAYFAGASQRLFSFDAEHCPPAELSRPRPFYTPEVSLPVAEESIEVDLAELRRFFAHPVRYFFRERLGIQLEEREALLEIHEPFVPAGLESYRLREAQFAALQMGRNEAETRALLRARGWLPSGVAGDLAARQAQRESLELWQQARPWLAAPPVALQVDYTAHGVHLSDRLEGLTARGLLHVRHGSLRAKDRLRLWIDHLLVNALAPAHMARTSALIARDGSLHLLAVAQAAERLDELFALYRLGLTRPLPFYPETAWAFVSGKEPQKVWQGDANGWHAGERDDPYLRLFLRDRGDDALDEEFRRLAEAIFRPLLKALSGQ
jgi:exodeoxyribonuclease V gamma subunit